MFMQSLLSHRVSHLVASSTLGCKLKKQASSLFCVPKAPKTALAALRRSDDCDGRGICRINRHYCHYRHRGRSAPPCGTLLCGGFPAPLGTALTVLLSSRSPVAALRAKGKPWANPRPGSSTRGCPRRTTNGPRTSLSRSAYPRRSWSASSCSCRLTTWDRKTRTGSSCSTWPRPTGCTARCGTGATSATRACTPSTASPTTCG